jgi:hypothetical protein
VTAFQNHFASLSVAFFLRQFQLSSNNHYCFGAFAVDTANGGMFSLQLSDGTWLFLVPSVSAAFRSFSAALSLEK